MLWFIFWVWMPTRLFFRLIRVFMLEKQRVSTVTFLNNRIKFLLCFYYYCQWWPLRLLRQGEVSEPRPGNGTGTQAHGLLDFNGIQNAATHPVKTQNFTQWTSERFWDWYHWYNQWYQPVWSQRLIEWAFPSEADSRSLWSEFCSFRCLLQALALGMRDSCPPLQFQLQDGLKKREP